MELFIFYTSRDLTQSEYDSFCTLITKEERERVDQYRFFADYQSLSWGIYW